MERNELTRRVINGVEVIEGSDNVFADLGLPNADSLLAAAERARQISEDEHVRGRGRGRKSRGATPRLVVKKSRGS
ncbi:MAG TPA: hypothetical protein VF647_23960 [Longimicrobium sp.]|jgi:hypothetical protein